MLRRIVRSRGTITSLPITLTLHHHTYKVLHADRKASHVAAILMNLNMIVGVQWVG